MDVFHEQKKKNECFSPTEKNDCFQPTEKKWLFSTDRRKKMTVFKNSHFFYSLENESFSTFWAVYFFLISFDVSDDQTDSDLYMTFFAKIF